MVESKSTDKLKLVMDEFSAIRKDSDMCGRVAEMRIEWKTLGWCDETGTMHDIEYVPEVVIKFRERAEPLNV